jgi:hypothetical protein
MKILEMHGKYTNPSGSMKKRNLDEVVAGGAAEDFVQDGDILKIIPQSKEGFYDDRFGKNAVFVITERATVDDKGVKTDLDEAVQLNLSAFDRVAAPWRKEADGKLVRDGESVRADGTAVKDWKAAKSAKAFFTDNAGKYLKITLKQEVETRAWDRASSTWSETELRKQKVYTIDWA